ncbi:hypothetical protein BCV70DRAFT_224858 [Testicularia cyperi]|uniref:RNA exonuclease 4 n=1 Tax=Testicularia cyperi TaxID=1882483 RepID=A0A317XYN4_9BASI|nr:hypothetical protein BCV70DRAFT_224858 [Testicularia cyperi]
MITEKKAPAAVSSSAGSNWKALKRSLTDEASISSKPGAKPKGPASIKPHANGKVTKTQASAPTQGLDSSGKNMPTGSSSSSTAPKRAPTALPWFAEDISTTDLELVRQSAEDLKGKAMQWEGIVDPQLKKRIILSGLPDDASEAKKEPGNYLAIDCEMVGVGYKGSESVLARVSIVNFHGATIYDRFVKPQEKVTDYRTWVSGVRPKDLARAPLFSEVQSEVAALIKGKVLVGHAIQNDLKALLLSHPKPLIRDTATFQPLRDLAKTKYPSLKKLAQLVLGIDIQLEGESHSSVEDARATMAVFRSQKSKWDEMIRTKKIPGMRGTHETRGGPSTTGAHTLVQTPARGANNKVWQPPENGAAVDASSPALARRSFSSRSNAAAANSNTTDTPAAASTSTIRLKPRMAAQADWWKDAL